MNIKETFLKLTEWTFPYGTEYRLESLLPKGFKEDDFGNYYLKLGESDTMFTCHLDTCSSKYEKVNHIIGSRFIKTDGSTLLGADDKAGVTILLFLIKNNVPGLYYFFVGEEVGGVGSGNLSSTLDFSDYKKCISFDRRGYNSIITRQWSGRCCSDDFAIELAKQLNSKNLSFNFEPDPTGAFTDSDNFINQIPECTNISVGYFDEHKVTEKQDILFLDNLCHALVKVDWNSLPIIRDSDDIYSDYDDYDDYYGSSELSTTINVWVDNKKWCAKLTNQRVIEERSHIYNWVIRQGYYFNLQSVDWNGKTAVVNYNGISEYLGEREDLIYIISELEMIPIESLDLIQRLA
jgi:hypothetical protein